MKLMCFGMLTQALRCHEVGLLILAQYVTEQMLCISHHNDLKLPASPIP